ncbi:MAG: glycoside hydrolase family 3 C-terminal domain-containing protein [Oscillospiraceae bacterium]|nr:glycoside hydrolase family 3 C-terminal domain-containing protein [Oscillospiraceae bacterium]
MKNRTKLWKGLTATVAVLLVIVMTASNLAFSYADIINTRLDITTSTISTETTGGEIYFQSEFGEFNLESQNKLIEATRQQTISEMTEGAVLLRNENNALPLSADERSVTFFGRASVDVVYRNRSAGNTPTDETATTLTQAFTQEGFELNPTLWNAYENSNVARDIYAGDIGEVPAGFYTDTLKSSWDSRYNDVAFIFLSRESGEGQDFFMNDSEGVSALSLHDSERAMVEMVTSSGKFGKVIVLLNTPAPMELDWLEEYNIDACLWIGTPGNHGFTGVAELIVGKANPSGRLVDTYAANSLSAPATIGSGTNTPTYVNTDAINAVVKDAAINTNYVTVYAEGIYVGYKYYETRYEDCILGQGGANAAVGASYGLGTWDYAAEMVYPFGYGLSYTTFEQTLDGVVDNGDGTMTVTVSVTNTGDIAGKSVVEIYAQTPYGEYEKENLVEKSAIQLLDFGKTSMLEPGASQTLSINVDKYLLASYDYTNTKTYVMSEGTYYIAIGTDCHDALNNVLAAKGAAGMFDQNGAAVAGDPTKTFSWTEEFDPVSYSTSSATGYPVTNHFDNCNLNTYIENTVTYISRQDWAATYPTGSVKVAATDEMIKLISGETYVKPADAPSASSIVQGDNQGISFFSMRGVAYDDKQWDAYLSQMTVEELCSQLPEGFGTRSVNSVGKPTSKTGDGIDSIEGKLPFGDSPRTNTYTSKIVLTSTWNRDLYRRRGELMGEEALFRGMVCIFNVGGDLHRTPFGGRNHEYMSEDGVMGYLASTPEVQGVLSKGVSPAIKHFAGNDQESFREGLNTFFNEQAFRENNLRIFEGAIKVGGTHALMQGLHRLGCTYDPAHRGLNTEVLRNEWGFEGFAETDGTAGQSFKHHFAESLSAGTSVYCLDSGKDSGAAIMSAIYDNDDGYMLTELRRAVKDYHYTLVNGCSVNGMSVTAVVLNVTPWWQTALYAVNGVLIAATLVSLLFFIKSKYSIHFKKKKEG